MEAQQIVVNIKGMVNLRLEQLNEFQDDIKVLTEERYASFKEEVLADGFDFSPHVWQDSNERFWLLDGHQRKTLLTRMKAEGYHIPTIPCVEVQAESLEHARRMVLAGTSQYGTFQPKKLTAFIKLAGLSGEQVLKRFYIPEVQLKKLVPVTGHMRELEGDDENTEPPAVAITKPGDVWIMGQHRLLCGDATKLDDFQKLMDRDRADAVWTDPPYNVDYEGKTQDRLKIDNDKMGNEDFRAFLKKAFTNMAQFTKAGGAAYVAHADTEGVNFRTAFTESGFLLKQCLVWVKNAFVMGRQDYHWRHEPILYGWKEGAAHEWFGDRSQSTVLEFNRPQRNGEHPTMKPVELVEYCLENSCPRGGIVLDPFAGAGSTLVACELGGRRARLLEIAPGYCDVIVARWEKLTGQKAVLAPSPVVAAHTQ